MIVLFCIIAVAILCVLHSWIRDRRVLKVASEIDRETAYQWTIVEDSQILCICMCPPPVPDEDW